MLRFPNVCLHVIHVEPWREPVLSKIASIGGDDTGGLTMEMGAFALTFRCCYTAASHKPETAISGRYRVASGTSSVDASSGCISKSGYVGRGRKLPFVRPR